MYDQKPNQSNSKYLTEFKALVTVNQTYNENLGEHPGLINTVLEEDGVAIYSATK